MIPKLTCRVCNAELQRTDKFCAHCGAGVEGEDSHGSTGPGTIQCSLCGSLNSYDSVNCGVCGATLTRQKIFRQPRQKNRPQSPAQKQPSNSPGAKKPDTFRFLQSGKLTAGLGVVFAVVLVIVALSRNQNNPPEKRPKQSENLARDATQSTLHEIEQLQKVVDTNPGDMRATLQLANSLHDVKFFPRAVTMYQRYLKSNPANPDARVDLGICFFEMALADSARRPEYIRAARSEMEKALTYNPKHQLAYYNLGIVSLQSGNVEESKTFFKKCIDLNPRSETGKRAEQLYNQHQFNTFTQ